MKRNESYVDLDGNEILLSDLDAGERKLIARLRRRAETHADWNDFDNYWLAIVAEFHLARGLSRPQIRRTAAYRVGQDLSSRLGIAQGMIASPDYRDQLEDLVLNRFPSRRAFCKATGVSEDMLSHVLAGRKDFSLSVLSKALARIGYHVRITPAKRTG